MRSRLPSHSTNSVTASASPMSRILRDRVFRRVVLRAYDERCAITGLKLINGRGRAEVAAAHIRPVEASGPDIVSNGIALSGTAHWMFDRGLISLSDDLEILISRQTNNPQEIRSIINKSGHALAPPRMSDRPHPHFLKWHRRALLQTVTRKVDQPEAARSTFLCGEAGPLRMLQSVMPQSVAHHETDWRCASPRRVSCHAACPPTKACRNRRAVPKRQSSSS